MKIYLVSDIEPYEGTTPLAAFSDREKATLFARAVYEKSKETHHDGETYGDIIGVYEITLDWPPDLPKRVETLGKMPGVRI